ncbi:MAG: hypothetical protein AAGA93_25420, partial [Actinomycetota bacterium]
QILVHCRQLFDASTQLNHLAVGRHQAAFDARRQWEGEHEATFALRMSQEADDLTARSRDLLDDADAWAHIWADTVNQINRERRAAAVDRVRSERSAGERFVDVFHGDDSDDLVRPVDPVAAPTAHTRYAATGGLESF